MAEVNKLSFEGIRVLLLVGSTVGVIDTVMVGLVGSKVGFLVGSVGMIVWVTDGLTLLGMNGCNDDVMGDVAGFVEGFKVGLVVEMKLGDEWVVDWILGTIVFPDL